MSSQQNGEMMPGGVIIARSTPREMSCTPGSHFEGSILQLSCPACAYEGERRAAALLPHPSVGWITAELWGGAGCRLCSSSCSHTATGLTRHGQQEEPAGAGGICCFLHIWGTWSTSCLVSSLQARDLRLLREPQQHLMYVCSATEALLSSTSCGQARWFCCSPGQEN